MTDISKFINRFDGGARPNLFKVTFTGVPTGNLDADTLQVYCKAAQVPATTLGAIPVNFMGRIVNIPGDRTFEDWTVTVINDEAMTNRRFFEQWNAWFNGHLTNVGQGNGQSHIDALSQATAVVEQLDRQHKTQRAYTLKHVWCENVQAYDVSYNDNDTVSEFQVTFKYHGLSVGDAPSANSAELG